MTNRETQRRLDALAMKYLTAVEAGDFGAVAALWLEAEIDSDLAEMLHELNAELVRIEDAEEAAEAKGVIESTIQQHMPSAEVVRPTSGPLTVSDVAEHLRRNPPRGITTDDLVMNDLLRESSDVVPGDLGMNQVVSWGRKFGSAPEGYWKAFREAALLLRMRRESENHQMAARPRKPPKPAGGKG